MSTPGTTSDSDQLQWLRLSASDADDIVDRLNRFIDSLHVGHAALAHARARRTELQGVADSLWGLVDVYQRHLDHPTSARHA